MRWEIDGMREWYQRYLRRGETKELKESRAKFWTNIDADNNRAKNG